MLGSLSVLAGRPVSGCTLRPQAQTRRDVSWNSDEVEYRWRWLRGARRVANCASRECAHAHDYDPANASRRGNGLLCSPCLKLGVPHEQLTFCSQRCFVDAWPQHRERHRQHIVPPRPRLDSDANSRSSKDGTNGRDGNSSSMIPAKPDLASEKSDGSQLKAYAHAPEPKDWNDEADAEWEVVAENVPEYMPSDRDIGHRLRIECYAVTRGTTDLIARGRAKTAVVLAAPEPPPRRPLVGQHAGIRPDLRIVSYNVLAEIYATRHAYPYCQRWALEWQYRVRSVVEELVACDADVLCLQEAQRDHYEADLEPMLRSRGYEGCFTQKSRESMGAAGKVDGCAVFWNSRRWRLSEQRSVCFNELAIRSSQNLQLGGSDEHAFLTRLVKDNVAQFVVLEALDVRGRRVCVANTHLYSHKDFPDTKLWQTLALLRSLEAFVNGRPLILAGDFNSGPETSVYELLATQSVDPRRPELFLDQAHQSPGRFKILPDPRNITHSLALSSAYCTVLGKEPDFTNLTQAFQGTLDYVWFDPRAMRCTAVAPIPDIDELTRAGDALPNAQFPSDHVLLCADFVFVPKQ